MHTCLSSSCCPLCCCHLLSNAGYQGQGRWLTMPGSAYTMAVTAVSAVVQPHHLSYMWPVLLLCSVPLCGKEYPAIQHSIHQGSAELLTAGALRLAAPPLKLTRSSWLNSTRMYEFVCFKRCVLPCDAVTYMFAAFICLQHHQ